MGALKLVIWGFLVPCAGLRHTSVASVGEGWRVKEVLDGEGVVSDLDVKAKVPNGICDAEDIFGIEMVW